MAETPAASAPAEKIDSASTSAPTTPLPHDGGYPRGHLGHLSESEEEAFRSFKAFLEEKGLYQPGPPASHDDPTLLYVKTFRATHFRLCRRRVASGCCFCPLFLCSAYRIGR